MDLYVLDENFSTVFILDTYTSFIWTDRYSSPGDFEIYSFPSIEILENVKKNYYIWNRESEHLMIVETIQIDTDVEDGVALRIAGRSLESILDRRIVWQQTDISGNLQAGIKRIITESIISPTIEDRKISNFIFQETDDSFITELTMENQYTGDTVLDIIQELCDTNGIGFKIILDDDFNFVFSLFVGKDRTYNQTENTYVIFSPDFNNIKNSNYIESVEAYKNVTLVAGEGEGKNRKTKIVGEGIGLLRRELYIDARDLSSTSYDANGNSKTLNNTQYMALLEERGKEKLKEVIEIKSFEGEIDTDDPNSIFQYKRDFYIGDDVQVVNEFGIEGTARIVEFVISDSTDGYKAYPTFQTITDDSEEEDDGN